jgi:hypothetical protein
MKLLSNAQDAISNDELKNMEKDLSLGAKGKDNLLAAAWSPARIFREWTVVAN